MLLKNRKIISKIRRSKVTDYAALNKIITCTYPAHFPVIYMSMNIVLHENIKVDESVVRKRLMVKT